MVASGRALTIRQGALLYSAAEGSHDVHAVGLHRQLVAGEGLQRHQQHLLSRAAHQTCGYNTQGLIVGWFYPQRPAITQSDDRSIFQSTVGTKKNDTPVALRGHFSAK